MPNFLIIEAIAGGRGSSRLNLVFLRLAYRPLFPVYVANRRREDCRAPLLWQRQRESYQW